MAYDAITAGHHVERFLGDEVIQQVMLEQRQVYFSHWMQSNDPAERERLHARARALDDLVTSLQAVADAGTLAKLAQDDEQRPSRD